MELRTSQGMAMTYTYDRSSAMEGGQECKCADHNIVDCDVLFWVAIDAVIFPSDEDKHNPGFNVEWYNGSFTQDCLEGLTTEMIFLCNESAKWTTEDQTANLIHVYYSGFCSVSAMVKCVEFVKQSFNDNNITIFLQLSNDSMVHSYVLPFIHLYLAIESFLTSDINLSIFAVYS